MIAVICGRVYRDWWQKGDFLVLLFFFCCIATNFIETMFVNFGKITKRRNFILAIVLLLYGTNGQEIAKNPPFVCPVECPRGVYRPICSRGISYANLCVLKQQICQGNAALEIYKDVEDCPKYEKDEDAKGASIEAIDKNGVIFRTLTDSLLLRLRHNTNRASLTSSSSFVSDGKKEQSSDTLGEQDKELKRSMCARQIVCSILEIGYPVCVLDIQLSSLCAVKRLICESYLPSAALLLVKSCN